MPKNPEFEQKLKRNVVAPERQQHMSSGLGVIVSFNPTDNTATVIMAQPNSPQLGEFYNNVPCPVLLGVQTAAPESGRLCWLVFKEGSANEPVVTHYFGNESFDTLDFPRQYQVKNDVPKFLREI